MKKIILFIMILAVILFAGCEGSGISVADQMDFADSFMLTFETERIGGLESRAVEPLLMAAGGGSAVSRATVPASDTSPLDFSVTSGTFSDYPLPDLTTTYTVEDASTVGSNVYKITSTTAYPDDHVIDTYVETYYIRNDTVGDDTANEWNYNDPVVDASGTPDPTARVSMVINYRDGSIRNEYIVKLVYQADAEDGFAAFDVEGSLLYPDFAYPAEDSDAYFSSIVVYTHDRKENHDYWFWKGTEQQKIVGVRYYTEHETNGGNNIQGTLVSYERAVSAFNPEAADEGTFKANADAAFLGTELDTLAESVFRQKVIFDMTGDSPQALIQDSYMRSHVVNAEDYADFILEKINEDSAVLLD